MEREATVLDLLDLEHREVLGRRGDVEEVEGAAGVDGVEAGEVRAGELAVRRREALGGVDLAAAEALDAGHERDLDGGEEVGVAEDLGAAGLAVEEHLAGLRPHAARDAERLGDDDAGDGEHGPARVNHLRDAVLLDVAVLTEAEGVEAVVAGESAVEVRGDVRVGVEETRGEVEAAVGA